MRDGGWWLLALLVASACAERPDGDDRDDDSLAVPAVVAAPPDSTDVQAAEGALAAFLDASREGSTTRSQLPSLTSCGAGAAASAGPMLARFELLAPSFRGDTIVGRAVVTTVADQDVDRIHPGYFVARLRVRSDTLEWDVLRGDAGDWVVCNGLHFGLAAPDSLTAWRPAGASAVLARALADSIGRTRAR
jgi:hypothetical protein